MDRENDLLVLRKEVERCRRCGLHKTRNNAVFGEGSVNVRIMLCGEAPGYWEDQKGRPFVGDAGKFLNELLTIAGLKREEVFIANILKCRTPGNREPKPEEIRACTPFLNRQIEIIKPRIICTLGNYATSYILEKYGFKPESMGRVHGKVFRVSDLSTQVKIIPMYHPATALYKPYMKEIIKQDWRLIKKELM